MDLYQVYFPICTIITFEATRTIRTLRFLSCIYEHYQARLSLSSPQKFERLYLAVEMNCTDNVPKLTDYDMRFSRALFWVKNPQSLWKPEAQSWQS
jgi:hypothetical protein